MEGKMHTEPGSKDFAFALVTANTQSRLVALFRSYFELLSFDWHVATAKQWNMKKPHHLKNEATSQKKSHVCQWFYF